MTVEDMKKLRTEYKLPECYDLDDSCPTFCTSYPCNDIIDFELKVTLNPESVFFRERPYFE